MFDLAIRMSVLTGILAGAALALTPVAAQETVPVPLTRQSVFFDPMAPVLGNPRGDVAIVEFFDYQCPYCRKMHPTLSKVVAADGNVRLVMKDWPIFGPASRHATEMALAARYQDAYPAAHDALMRLEGKLTEAAIDDALQTAGVDLERARADLAAHRAEIEALLERNDEQAMAFGFGGTPAMVIERFLFPGAMDEAGLVQAIRDARGGR